VDSARPATTISSPPAGEGQPSSTRHGSPTPQPRSGSPYACRHRRQPPEAAPGHAGAANSAEATSLAGKARRSTLVLGMALSRGGCPPAGRTAKTVNNARRAAPREEKTGGNASSEDYEHPEPNRCFEGSNWSQRTYRGPLSAASLACFDAEPGQDNDQELGISGSDGGAVWAVSKCRRC